MGSSRRLSGEAAFSVKLTQTTRIGWEGNLESMRGNSAGSTPYKLPEKILTAIEAGSPRYSRVIFCVQQRYFPRQNDRAQVNRN
jgi:hypothetical protein